MSSPGRRWFGAAKRPLWQAFRALTGRRIQARTHYADFGMYGGYFEVDSRAARRRLPPGLEVVEHRAGVTELEVWCAEYRRIETLRPYNELGVLLPVRFAHDDAPPLEGMYVLEMPVTTEEARWGGADNYGFPKFLAEIAITHGGDQTLCTVTHRGVHVLGLRVDARPCEPFRDTTTLFNVRDDGRVIECTFETSGERAVAPAAGGVALELGQHAIADELGQLGVRPAGGRGLYLPTARGVLGKGIDLGPLPARAEAAPPGVSVSAARAAPPASAERASAR